MIVLMEIQNYYIDHVINNMIFILLLASMLVDIITGNIVALKQRKWNSRTGINGSLRHFAIFAIVFILSPIISITIGNEVISNGIVFYIIGQYTISIVENMSAFGFEFSEVFSKYFDYLKAGSNSDKQLNKGKDTTDED